MLRRSPAPEVSNGGRRLSPPPPLHPKLLSSPHPAPEVSNGGRRLSPPPPLHPKLLSSPQMSTTTTPSTVVKDRNKLPHQSHRTGAPYNVTPEVVARHAEEVCVSPSQHLTTHGYLSAGGNLPRPTASPTFVGGDDARVSRGGATSSSAMYVSIPSCYNTTSTNTSVQASPKYLSGGRDNRQQTDARGATPLHVKGGRGGQPGVVGHVSPERQRATSPPLSAVPALAPPIGKLRASNDTNRRLAAVCHTFKQVNDARAYATHPAVVSASHPFPVVGLGSVRPLSSSSRHDKPIVGAAGTGGVGNTKALNTSSTSAGGATVSPLSDRSLSPLSWADDGTDPTTAQLPGGDFLLSNSMAQQPQHAKASTQWNTSVGLVRQRRAEQDEAKMMHRLTEFLLNDERRCVAKSVYVEKMLDERRVLWSRVFVHASFVAMLAHHVTLRRAYDVLKQKFLYRYLRFVRKKRSTRLRAQRLKERETLMTAPPSAEVLSFHIPILQKLPEDTVAALRAVMTKRCIFAGEFLAYEGEPGDSVAVLHQGALTVSRKSAGSAVPLSPVTSPSIHTAPPTSSSLGGLGGKLAMTAAAAAKLSTVVVELINGSACPVARPPAGGVAPLVKQSPPAVGGAPTSDVLSKSPTPSTNVAATASSNGGRLSSLLSPVPGGSGGAKRASTPLSTSFGVGTSSLLSNSHRSAGGSNAPSAAAAAMTSHQTYLSSDKANTYGWSIGQTMLFTAEPYDASFRAAVDTDLWILGGPQFVEIVVRTMKGVAPRQLEFVNRLIDERRASNMSQHRRMTEQAVRSSSPLFQFLSSAGIARLIRCLRPQVVRRGDIVVDPGKYGTQVVFVVAGRVEVYYGPGAGVSVPAGYGATTNGVTSSAAGGGVGAAGGVPSPGSPTSQDKKMIVEVFRVGSCAGEVASYLGKSDPKSYVRAAANAELWMLDATDLQAVLIHEESRAVMVSVLTLLDEGGNEKIFRTRSGGSGAAASGGAEGGA